MAKSKSRSLAPLAGAVACFLIYSGLKRRSMNEDVKNQDTISSDITKQPDTTPYHPATQTQIAPNQTSSIEIDIEDAIANNYDLLTGNDTASPDSVEELVEAFAADYKAQSSLYCKDEFDDKEFCNQVFSKFYLPARFACESMHDPRLAKEIIDSSRGPFFNLWESKPELSNLMPEYWACKDYTFRVGRTPSHEAWVGYQQE